MSNLSIKDQVTSIKYANIKTLINTLKLLLVLKSLKVFIRVSESPKLHSTTKSNILFINFISQLLSNTIIV